jgi:hypothetical protein
MVDYVLLATDIGNIQMKCIILLLLFFFLLVDVALVTLTSYMLHYLLKPHGAMRVTARYATSQIVENKIHEW